MKSDTAKSPEIMFSRMREDELVARTRYHEDRLKEAERLAAFHRIAWEAARAELEALRISRSGLGPTGRGLPALIPWDAPDLNGQPEKAPLVHLRATR